jgi:hypothetical protein
LEISFKISENLVLELYQNGITTSAPSLSLVYNQKQKKKTKKRKEKKRKKSKARNYIFIL